MKIRPVILCGGAGTRLWENKKHHQPKQFIDFGGWTLMQKTLERIKNPFFDSPILSTNSKYLSKVKKLLKEAKIKEYKIIKLCVYSIYVFSNVKYFFGLLNNKKYKEITKEPPTINSPSLKPKKDKPKNDLVKIPVNKTNRKTK